MFAFSATLTTPATPYAVPGAPALRRSALGRHGHPAGPRRLGGAARTGHKRLSSHLPALHRRHGKSCLSTCTTRSRGARCRACRVTAGEVEDRIGDPRRGELEVHDDVLWMPMRSAARRDASPPADARARCRPPAAAPTRGSVTEQGPDLSPGRPQGGRGRDKQQPIHTKARSGCHRLAKAAKRSRSLRGKRA